MKIELETGRTQNMEPEVGMHFGPDVSERDRDEALSMCLGYGLSCGWGPGPLSDATAAAKRLAKRLRRLGWSVSIV